VLELLEGLRPKADEEDLRIFEWHHLWRRCHVGRRLSFRLPSRGCVAVSSDGKALAAACHDSTVRLYDAATGREQGILAGHHLHLWCLAFSPDSKTLATTGDDGGVKVWSLNTHSSMQTR
jgi:WD40 repeat protein